MCFHPLNPSPRLAPHPRPFLNPYTPTTHPAIASQVSHDLQTGENGEPTDSRRARIARLQRIPPKLVQLQSHVDRGPLETLRVEVVV